VRGTADDGDPAFWDRKLDDPPRPRGERRLRFAKSDASSPLAERVRALLGDTRAGVVVLIIVAVVAGFVWYRMGAGGAAHGEAPTASPTVSHAGTATTRSSTGGSSSAGGSATTVAGSRIVVHVAGAVTKPGVVELAAGARVIDAIEAVGGALPDGDLDRLNLAAKLADGQRVYVGRPGVADPGGAGSGDSVGASDGGAAAPGAKLNLNTASQAQLEELPGVGPAFAQAILAERQRRGGFTSVNDLRSVRGIGDKRFADLSPLVTV
jgi:competence protein ComEA